MNLDFILHFVLTIGLLFVGCCTNVITLELILKEDESAGVFVTFCQVIFIAVEGFLHHLEFSSSFPYVGIKERVIPISSYIIGIFLFFTISVANSKVYDLGISVPLHMVIRSSSLVPAMILGRVLQKQTYSDGQYLAVLCVTLGISFATLASYNPPPVLVLEEGQPPATGSTWILGVVLLFISLFLSAYQGIFQERLYKQYGFVSRENMFYSHFMSLPLFVLLMDDISGHMQKFSASTPMDIFATASMRLAIPRLWAFVMVNVVTQYICIRGVFTLFGLGLGTLNATLIVNLRKFFSLVISVLYFQNPFLLLHWLGALLVFGGICLYTLSINYPVNLWSRPDSTEKKRKEKKERKGKSSRRRDRDDSHSELRRRRRAGGSQNLPSGGRKPGDTDSFLEGVETTVESEPGCEEKNGLYVLVEDSELATKARSSDTLHSHGDSEDTVIESDISSGDGSSCLSIRSRSPLVPPENSSPLLSPTD
eukprot:Rmarinus@m.28405